MPRTPSVFMIGWEYPPHNSGGLGVACEGMTQALADAGHHISFTLPYDFAGDVSHMNVLSCVDPSWGSQVIAPPFSVYGASQAFVKNKLSLNPDDLKHIPQSDLEAKVEQYADQVLSQSNKENAFDVIHAHDWLSFPAAIALKEESGKPLVAHIHSTEYDRIPSGNGSPYIIATEQKGIAAADKVIAVSYYTKQLLIQKYFVDPRKIEVVHNGIIPVIQQPLSHTFAASRPVIVFMGRLTEQKGGEFFLRLAQQVIAKVPNALFVIAGHGDMYHQLLLSSAHKELSAHVMFSGFLRDTQKNQLLDRADAFIMPSLSEPFGLVALEAAQRNTPVIISKQTGVAEVLPSAIQIDFWDTENMAQQLELLIKNKKVSQTQILNQNTDMQKVTWQNSAQKIQQVYRNSFLGI